MDDNGKKKRTTESTIEINSDSRVERTGILANKKFNKVITIKKSYLIVFNLCTYIFYIQIVNAHIISTKIKTDVFSNKFVSYYI